ncbi:DUF202 domain-containing protein [Streptomyces sp. NPDC004749]
MAPAGGGHGDDGDGCPGARAASAGPGPGSEPAPRRDPGLQPERTRLAWRRTTLACTVATVLAVRQAIHDGGTATGLTAAALSALIWLAFLGVAHRRLLALGTPRPERLSVRTAATATACAVVLAAVAVTVMF